MAQAHVAEADVDQCLQLLADQGHVSEDRQRVFNGEVENVGDGVAVEFNSQGFLVVATPVAHLALYVDVGHEVHFDAALAVPLAGLAAASGDVEAEAAGLVSPLAGFGKHGEEVAEGREDLCVGGGIGARGAADGGLVDADHLVDLVFAGERLVGTRFFARSIKIFS